MDNDSRIGAGRNITVIVPAHNEAAGIAPTLTRLVAAMDEAVGPRWHLLVACNGCRDGTAAAARAAAPGAQVLDLAEQGKAVALNHALAQAADGAVIVVDADIAVDGATLQALADTLAEDGVLAASPAVHLDAAGAVPLVRAWFRIFAQHPYLATGVGGAGVYGLSAAGRARLGAFPAIAADDHYLRCLFPASAQRRVSRGRGGVPVGVRVQAPRTLAALLRVERRARAGDRVVHALLPPEAPHVAPIHWHRRALLGNPLDFGVYVAVKLLVRVMIAMPTRQRGHGWQPERG